MPWTLPYSGPYLAIDTHINHARKNNISEKKKNHRVLSSTKRLAQLNIAECFWARLGMFALFQCVFNNWNYRWMGGYYGKLSFLEQCLKSESSKTAFVCTPRAILGENVKLLRKRPRKTSQRRFFSRKDLILNKTIKIVSSIFPAIFLSSFFETLFENIYSLLHHLFG